MVIDVGSALVYYGKSFRFKVFGVRIGLPYLKKKQGLYWSLVLRSIWSFPDAVHGP